jgi:hypothetical protein
MKLLRILTIIFLMVPGFYNLSLASNCSTHNDSENENIDTQLNYNFPCEISGTILMAESEEICTNLKVKISSHDHD